MKFLKRLYKIGRKIIAWILAIAILAALAVVCISIKLIKQLWKVASSLILFAAGIVFPVVYTVVSWECLIARDIISVTVLFMPAMYWKVYNTLSDNKISGFFVAIGYLIAIIIGMTIYVLEA